MRTPSPRFMQHPLFGNKSLNRTTQLYLSFSMIGAMVLPAILSEYGYPYYQVLLATLLIIVCVYPTARYFARNETGIPTMAILCLAYALQFGLPIFTRDPTFELMAREVRFLDDSDVIAALLMSIMGVGLLQLGYYRFRASKLVRLVPSADLPLNKFRAIIYCVLVGFVLPILFSIKDIIPEEYQAPLSSILTLLQNQMLVVIAILGWLVYSRRGSKWFVVALYGAVAIAALRGIGNGILEQALVSIGVLFIVKWMYTRRIPMGSIVVVAAIVLFLSPVKGNFRQRVMSDPSGEELAGQSLTSKAAAWIDQASDYWLETLKGDRDLTEATSGATLRTDLIHQIAHIHSMTPSVIPYQYGETYSYFAVSAIPRVLWPDKPRAGSANRFFGVTYGLQTEEGSQLTTFGVSILGEAYINFGWPGVAVIMLFQGLLLGLLHHLFGETRSGPGGQAVFLAFFVFFLNGIGSSAEILFGNVLQNLLCGYLLLLWARERRSTSEATDISLTHSSLYRRPDPRLSS
jgi:O-antigen polysaccharide polymerase Wzy